MKYFTKCTTLEELKAEYRRLAMLHHPDRGGDTEIMKEINREHDEIFEILKARQNANAEKNRQTTETAEEFRGIVDKLIKIPGLIIELCGSWLWISGNTREHKEELKKISDVAIYCAYLVLKDCDFSIPFSLYTTEVMSFPLSDSNFITRQWERMVTCFLLLILNQ